MSLHRALISSFALVLGWGGDGGAHAPPTAWPALGGHLGTDPVRDLAAELVAGVDRFLDRKLTASPTDRDRLNRRDVTSVALYEEGVAPDRARLAERLGVVEERRHFPGLEWVSSAVQPATVADSAAVRVRAVRWPAFGEVHGEGLLLEPLNQPVRAAVIALPDADLEPEAWVGLDPGVPAAHQVPRRLAESGCRVVVPLLVNRHRDEPKVEWDPQRGRNLSHREFLHRAAFEMGRTLAGYEVMKVLAVVDDFRRTDPQLPVGVLGWGEGGRLALYVGALDPRVSVVSVSGYFGPREEAWREPLDRNVFGLLNRFGDAELGAMIAPRALIVEAARGPELEVPSDGSAPGRLATPALEAVRREVARARSLVRGLPSAAPCQLVVSGDGRGEPGTEDAATALLEALSPGWGLSADASPLGDRRSYWDPRGRAERQRRELDAHTQRLLLESGDARERAWKALDTSSSEALAATQARYREFFAERVIGRFAEARLPIFAESRKAYDAPKWVGYEVVMDVYPDVMAYGLLLLPKDLESGERRPVVVCQHGLEGRPQHTIGEEGSRYYAAFAARLADEGFVTFAPQNLYLFGDRFRVLQRKANLLGKTLFSVMTPQHQQVVDWLKRQPFVDPERIAFYGLSYGGKTAMRVPALVTDYCLSICSADFNDWVWKNASTRSPYSYVWTGEYEIFEWNLGHTFNYAEMAALIAPRPFMVERGHFDGVAPDETVAYEFAKVRHLYAARLGLPPETCQIEWFVGPHQIHAKGTFEFLRRHLNWPPMSGR